jgi:diaminopimelate decarboxylase
MDSKGLKLREVSNIKEGDVLAILTAGAYGMSMASNYNMRILPAEVLVNNGEVKLIRKKQEFDDLFREQNSN